MAFQHRATAEMLDVVVDICYPSYVLREWQYSQEQCNWAREQLSILCCWGRQFLAISEGHKPILILE